MTRLAVSIVSLILQDSKSAVEISTLPSPEHSSVGWLTSLELWHCDEKQLLTGEWLTDKHITVANRLLKQQYPEQNGLCDTLLLAEKRKWASEPSDFDFLCFTCACNVNIYGEPFSLADRNGPLNFNRGDQIFRCLFLGDLVWGGGGISEGTKFCVTDPSPISRQDGPKTHVSTEFTLGLVHACHAF